MEYLVIDHADGSVTFADQSTITFLMGAGADFHLGVAVIRGCYDVIPVDMFSYGAAMLLRGSRPGVFQPMTTLILTSMAYDYFEDFANGSEITADEALMANGL